MYSGTLVIWTLMGQRMIDWSSTCAVNRTLSTPLIILHWLIQLVLTDAWSRGSCLGCGDLPGMGEVFHLGAGWWLQWKPLYVSGTHHPLNKAVCKNLITVCSLIWNLLFPCRIDNNPQLKDCIHCYTADWAIVNRRLVCTMFLPLFEFFYSIQA